MRAKFEVVHRLEALVVIRDAGGTPVAEDAEAVVVGLYGAGVLGGGTQLLCLDAAGQVYELTWHMDGLDRALTARRDIASEGALYVAPSGKIHTFRVADAKGGIRLDTGQLLNGEEYSGRRLFADIGAAIRRATETPAS